MAATLVDLVKINITSTGTGALKLGNAVTGFRGVEALLNGRDYSYSIQQEANWEVGRGTWLEASSQMVRQVLFSSNGGMPISLKVGAQVSFVALSQDILLAQLAQQVVVVDPTGTSSSFAYAHNPASLSESLSQFASAVIGRSYFAAAFGANGRGAGQWRCIAAQSGTPNVGTVVYESGNGLVLEGVSFRFALITEREVDPAQIGAGASSVTDAGLWERTRQFCVATGVMLRPSGGDIAAQALSLAAVPFVDGRGIRFREDPAGYAGALVNLDMTGISSADPRWSYLIARGINVGPNSALGQYDFQGTLSQATGFVLTGDNGGNSVREFHANRLATGLRIIGNTEKNTYRLHAVFCGVAATVDTAGGSPDTLRLEISGTNNKQVFLTGDGDTSIMLDLNTEARIDDGATQACYWNAAVTRPTAYIEVRNGKHFQLSGRHRAHNGRLMITDDRAYENGTDTLAFAGFSTIHTYGTVYSNYRIQRLTGLLTIKDAGNGRPNYAADDTTGGSIPCPVVHLRQVWDASGFELSASYIYAREAVRWGDAANGLFSIDAHMGRYSGNMANADNTNFDPPAGQFPTGQTFLYIEKAVRCVAECDFHGNVVAEAGASDCRLIMPNGANWVRQGYSARTETGGTLPAGRLSIELGGQIARDDLIWRPWAFDGLAANVPEFGGRTVRDGGTWSMPAAPAVTLAQLQSSSHWVNTMVKRSGAQVFYSGRPLFASGPNATDTWKDAAGTDVIASAAIVEQATTAALATRISGAGGAALSTAMRQVYDRLYFDLSEAGLLNKLILFYLLAAPEAVTARLNLKTGLASGPYDLSIGGGAPVFTAGRGYSGDGSTAFLATGYNPQVAAEGMGLTDMHIGLFSLQSGAGTIDAGSANGRLRIGAGDDATYYATSNSTSVTVSGTGGPPCHVVACRGSSAAGRAYRDGVLVNTDSLASSSLLPTAVELLRQGTNYSSEQVAVFHVGLNLSDAEAAAMSRIIRKALVQIGAI